MPENRRRRAFALAISMNGKCFNRGYARSCRLLFAAAAFSALALVAACRTAETSEEIQPRGEPVITAETETAADRQPETVAASQQPEDAAQPAQTYGKGPSTVFLLLHLSGALADADLNKSLINGARLAVEDLGPNEITLVVADTGSNPGGVAAALRRAVNAQLVIVPGEDSAIVSAIASGQKGSAPVVMLGSYEEAMSSGLYGFLPSWIAQFEQAASYASRTFNKKLKIAILEPPGMDSRLTGLLRDKLAKGAEKVDTVRYSAESGVAGLSAAGHGVLDSADAVIIMENDVAIAPFVDQLRKTDFSNGQKFFIVRGDAARDLAADPAFAGTIAGVPDFSNFDIVANRYRQIFATAMPLEAAYTYDAVAVAAGIVRANRDPIITKTLLETKSGFNGATGSFRFQADGQVERKYTIVRLAQDDLVVLEAAATEF